MAIGIKRSALVGIPCKIEEARLCPSCEIVTEREMCPLCESNPTIPHPESGSPCVQHYCMDCAGEFPNEQLRVKTWSFAPHDQCEGDLVCTCRECLLEYAMSDDPQAVWKA